MKPKSSPTRKVIGRHACFEAIRCNPDGVSKILFDEKVTEPWTEELRQLVKKHRLRLEVVQRKTLDAFGSGHQGLLVEMTSQPDFNFQAIVEREKCLLVACDGLEDPHNLGAIFRSSWLLGVNGLLLSRHASVGLTPSVHKVAAGGVEHVPVLEVSKFQDIFADLKAQGFWIYGLSASSSHTHWQAQYANKSVLVLGSEERGLRRTTESQCDELISIPQVSPSASLNVAVSYGIVLSEAQRQIRSGL